MSISEHYLISDFERRIAADAFAQSYIFFGESRAAREFVGRKLLTLFERGAEILLDGKVVEKNNEGTIGIDEVRNAIRWLWQSPLRAMRKSIFVVDGEALTAEAQNALLKVAEEPPKSGVLIVGVKDPGALIAPLVSRCERVYIGPTFAPSEKKTDIERAMEKLGEEFVRGAAAARKKIIGDLLKNEADLEEFVRATLAACRRDPVRHGKLMGRITDRWAKMSQFNVNKKLQLETLLEL